MGSMYRGALIGAAGMGLLTLSIPAAAAEFDAATNARRSSMILPSSIFEVAGADETDRATKDQLRRAGTEMIPAENLKKSAANPQPLATPAPPAPPSAPMAVEPQTPVPSKTVPVQTPVVRPEPDGAMALAGPYLRIDAGFGVSMNADGTQSAGNLSRGTIGNAPLFGGGIGYRFNDSFRSDVTFSYRTDAKVRATTAAGNSAATEVNGLSIMLNGYWDIMKLDAITPYVGAGLGYARLSTPSMTTTGGIANEGGADQSNLAWALMLGGTYQLSKEAAIDVGYRFIDLGKFTQAASTTYDDLMVHEARAGFRYAF